MKFVFELENVRHVIIEASLASLFNNVCPEKTALLYSSRDILWHPPISLLRRETCKFISFWRGKKKDMSGESISREVHDFSEPHQQTAQAQKEISILGLRLIWATESTGNSVRRTRQPCVFFAEQRQALWRRNTGISYQI